MLVLGAVTDPDAHALDRRPAIVGDQFLHGAILDHAHVRQSHQAAAHMPFQHRPGRQQSDQIARGRFERDAMADPVHVACDIAAGAAAGDDLVGPAREESLDHVPAACQQAMRMAALRHALARNIRLRKRIALQHGDDGVEIRQRTRGQQTAHAGADHNRMLTNMFHRNTPALFRLPPQGLRWYGGMIRRVLMLRSQICQGRPETPSPFIREHARLAH